MPYVTNFDPSSTDNLAEVVAQVNRIFGTELEIREHPNPDREYRSGLDVAHLHSLWSPHDHVVCTTSEFPYLKTEWFAYYCAHLHWIGSKAQFNFVYARERRVYARRGLGMDYPGNRPEQT